MEWTETAVAKCEAMLLSRSKQGERGCRVWIGSTLGKHGVYGQARFAKIYKGCVHRLSYLCHMRLLKLDSTLHVRHLCGNSLCIAPEHLTIGTPSENQADRIGHGTSNHGKRAKISIDIARAVKNSKGNGTSKDRAVRFGVTQAIVSNIDCGESWAWVGKTAEQDDKSKGGSRTTKSKTVKRKNDELFSQENLKRARTFILERVTNPRNKTLCSIWQRTIIQGGYGQASFRRPLMHSSTFYAHRLSYMAFNNTNIPAGQLVRHMCIGSRACVNPLHLELGNAKDNAADMVRDGTVSRMCGGDSSNASITEETALAILQSKGNGTQTARAARFETTIGVVSGIDKRKSWKHLHV